MGSRIGVVDGVDRSARAGIIETGAERTRGHHRLVNRHPVEARQDVVGCQRITVAVPLPSNTLIWNPLAVFTGTITVFAAVIRGAP